MPRTVADQSQTSRSVLLVESEGVMCELGSPNQAGALRGLSALPLLLLLSLLHVTTGE